MNYVYPKFSKIEFLNLRLGGAGLGNLLFMYSRAFKFAKENNCEFIWPTWKSIKIGPWVRREADKRFYGDLFKNNSGYVGGIKKKWILHTAKKVTEDTFDPNGDNQVVIFDKYIMDYTYFEKYRNEIKADLVKNVQEKNRKACEFDGSNCICAHIRLGDFLKANTDALQSGVNNMSTPVSWYVDIIKGIRETVGRDVKVYIFSDGRDEELKELLDLNNVERITFGTSIADILALSNAKLLIASGSTFSSWARFLGGMTTIAYENQLKCHGLCAEENIEIETAGEIPLHKTEKIQAVFQGK